MNDNGRPALDISSLIDVSFLLLIYFLATSTIDPRETDLPSMIAPPGGSGISSIDHLVIQVDGDGIVSVFDEITDSDSSVRELPHLTERLRLAHAAWKMSNREQPHTVIVDADDGASGQRFMDVMNCLAEVGIQNVVLNGFVE